MSPTNSVECIASSDTPLPVSEMLSESILVFYINGTRVEIDNPDPNITLLEYLRHIGLRGTKLACGEGACGACTVMISSYDQNESATRHVAVNACLVPICMLDGKHIVTVEGTTSTNARYAVWFCTPGMVLSLYTLLRNNPNPNERDIENAFDGNICRCTGYRSILNAAKTFAVTEDAPNEIRGCGVANCCKLRKENEDVVELVGVEKLELKVYDSKQEIIFPPALVSYLKTAITSDGSLRPLRFVGKTTTWYRPSSLADLLQLKTSHPEATLIAGGTLIQLDRQRKGSVYPVFIQLSGVAALNQVVYSDHGIDIGANKTLAELQSILTEACMKKENRGVEAMTATIEAIKEAANNQIRAIGTIGGNIAHALPSSSLIPVLVAAHATVNIATTSGEIESFSFYDLLTKGELLPRLSNGIIQSIHIPFTPNNVHIRMYRQARRKQNAAALVHAAMRVQVESSDNGQSTISECTIVYGEIGSTITLAKQTADAFKNVLLGDQSAFESAISTLMTQDLCHVQVNDDHLLKYQLSLANSFLFRFWCDISNQYSVLSTENQSAIHEIYRNLSRANQFYEDQRGLHSVGKSIEHASSLLHTTGEAVYLDDMPMLENEGIGVPILSTKAHAKILSIDASKALAQNGVLGFITSKDVLGSNKWGIVVPDEEIYISDIVTCVGQVIGLIVATDRRTAREAAQLVRVDYEEYPPIITMKGAIAQNSFFEEERKIQRGDVEAGFAAADYILEGNKALVHKNICIWVETQGCIAVPKRERGEMELFSATQDTRTVQQVVAQALNVPRSRIHCRVKRLGGGFGGKDSRSAHISGIAAVAAQKLKRPVRLILNREDDMIMTGKRHEFLGQWKVGVTKEGKITAYRLQVYLNGGFSYDLSIPVLGVLLGQCDNAYYFPNSYINGRVCKTNIPSSTALRGFGASEGMLITESVIHAIAERLSMPEANLYTEGQCTPYGQKVLDLNLPTIWRDMKENCRYDERRARIEQFNKESRWKKRGIAMVPTKFGIMYPPIFFCQAGAIVHIYLDGSVLLAHGGIEMGQGLHTKMIQVCAQGLDIPATSIYVSETGTNTVPNTTGTGASIGTDILLQLDACDQLRTRLQPYRERHPNATFKEENREYGLFRSSESQCQWFYKSREIGYNWETGKGDIDIMMDLGDSLNYELDVGQIEGGFTQGVGKLIYYGEVNIDSDGHLIARNLETYKVPAAGDIPKHLIKAVGEPPLFLGASVFFAIREAIKSVRHETGQTEPWILASPATMYRIQSMCAKPSP
ncbi:molybdopterin binding aldehyde oxidase/xanthine dehydrogenase [Syncephalis plumigaleata]|nr:molybdopterin binding aldehyde oxidase/xanthine dehydrogenase [Syncephalis plumigaleata]